MRRMSLLPFALIGLAGCVHTDTASSPPRTSASPADLRAFAAAICPKTVVPVHGVKWDEESEGFGFVRRLRDAETMVVQ